MTQPPKPRALPGRRHGAVRGPGSSVGGTFGAAAGWAGAAPLRELSVDAIRPNPHQPRKRFGEEALQALAESVRERGVLQPVLVRSLDSREVYELVAGERRWRAARLAGLQRLPAFVRDDTDDASALELALIENAAREDLTPVEEARTLSVLINDLGVTQSELARRTCKSRSDLANTLRLLDLPDDVLDLLDTGQLTKGHGKSLLSEPSVERRRVLAERTIAGGWSVRQLERAIASTHSTEHPAPTGAVTDDAAQSLADRLKRCVGDGVKVRRRGDGFAIQLVVTDLAAAEAIVGRLSRNDATHERSSDVRGPA
jgi:ParB family chromosome partitioning protein